MWCNSAKRKEAKPGDILMSVRAPVGSVNFCDRKSILGRGLSAIRAGSRIDSEFLYYFLKSSEQSIAKLGTGSTFKAITQETLKKIEIPLPPFDDQIRIAHLLGKVEGLIAQRKQHLQQLDELLKSVFLEMFGDPVRNEKGWDTSDFENILSDLRNGLSPSKGGSEKGCVYTLSAITGQCFKEIYKEDTFSQIQDKYFPKENDFLICRGNGNKKLVGKGYFFTGKSSNIIFPDTIIGVSIAPNTINSHFLESLWKTRFIRLQIENNARTTNGAYKINQEVIKKIKIIFPPSNLQDQFAAIVEKVESLKTRYQQSLADLETLYGALSQKAFKGELDLSRVPLTARELDHRNQASEAVEAVVP